MSNKIIDRIGEIFYCLIHFIPFRIRMKRFEKHNPGRLEELRKVTGKPQTMEEKEKAYQKWLSSLNPW